MFFMSVNSSPPTSLRLEAASAGCCEERNFAKKRQMFDAGGGQIEPQCCQ